jgi:hypothetical protein
MVYTVVQQETILIKTGKIQKGAIKVASLQLIKGC